MGRKLCRIEKQVVPTLLQTWACLLLSLQLWTTSRSAELKFLSSSAMKTALKPWSKIAEKLITKSEQNLDVEGCRKIHVRSCRPGRADQNPIVSLPPTCMCVLSSTYKVAELTNRTICEQGRDLRNHKSNKTQAQQPAKPTTSLSLPYIFLIEHLSLSDCVT